jgi:S-ribosylhomocysteine lyase
MGCLTGFYLILKGDLKPMDILPLMQETYRFMSSYQGEIPGAIPRDCGNYSYQDLPAARGEAASFLRVLENLGADRMVYPQ